ncbi:serine hydrolase domain-containing protein [Caulobacter sp. KR2-114]|uniref:serine hydrolase domain-containing protein n=1 Tax=Caulobacter sp. KR2-114 TaxID=3400912 RepID=UPI003C02FD57
MRASILAVVATVAALAGAPLAGAPLGGDFAVAADYRPVTCAAAAPYQGGALHSPPAPLPAAAGLPLAGDLDAATAARLQAAFDTAFKATRAHAMTVAVGVPGKGLWTARHEAGDQPPVGRPVFYWASVGKEATAAVVLQLADEGRIKLSDPISRWVPGVPNGQAITLEMLLAHTSGLFSANEDLQVHRQNRALSADEELAVLRRHGAMACPGERWRYSNSGYDLLGRVVEQVDGRPLAPSIQARLVTPLGLTALRALGPKASTDDVQPPVSDTAGEPAIDITAPGAAGPLAASAADMVRFQQALLTRDQLLPAATRAQMLQRPYPMFQPGMFYGLGLMLFDVGDGPGRLYWIGHSGGAPGVKAVSLYAPAQNLFIAVALTGDGSAEATANLLMKAAAGR